MDEDFLNNLGSSIQLWIRPLIPIQKPFITGFHSKSSDGTIQWLSLKYERMSDICFNCGTLGHFSINCTSTTNSYSTQAEGRRKAFGSWMKSSSPKKTYVQAPPPQPNELEKRVEETDSLTGAIIQINNSNQALQK